MNKIFWIEEGRLAGRCGPSVSPMDLPSFHAAGFRYILSLDANEYKLLDQRSAALPIELIHLPDSIPPQPLEVKIYETRLPEAVERVIGKLGEGNGAVLLHCHAGCDRTGGVLTGYLSRVKGISPSAALEEVRRANPRAITAEGYEKMILDVLEGSSRD